MAEKDESKSESSRAEKDDEEKEGSLHEQLRHATEAGVELAAGLTEAVAKGLRAFGDDLPKGDADMADWGKSLIRGTADGAAAAASDASKAVRRSADILLEEEGSAS